MDSNKTRNSFNKKTHLPNLNDVVLGHRADYPRLIVVPRKVRDFRRVTAMYEQQLGWTILSVVGRLVITDFAAEVALE